MMGVIVRSAVATAIFGVVVAAGMVWAMGWIWGAAVMLQWPGGVLGVFLCMAWGILYPVFTGLLLIDGCEE